MSFQSPSRTMILVLLTCLPGFARAEAGRPGKLLRLFCETKDGIQNLPGPATSTVAGSQDFKLADGTQITVAMAWPSPDHLVVRMTSPDSKGVISYGAAVEAREDEHFCGLMERVVDGDQDRSWKEGMKEALDLRGRTLAMYVKPTLGLYAPFYVSTAGYGIHVEGTWPGKYDMAAANPREVVFQFEGPGMVFHVLYGKTPMDILRAYAALVGKTILPPRWAFGHWRWRDDHMQREKFWDGTPYSGQYNAEIVEDILMMEALKIPCSVYWVDRPWATGVQGYEDFNWDTQRLPNYAAMIKWLEARDTRFLLWIAPWVLGDMIKEGQAKGYFMAPKKPEKDQRSFIDYTNPQAVEWWQGYLGKVIKEGVAGFKLDRSEENIPDTLEQKTHSGMTTREMHNAYPLQYAKAVHDVLKKLRGDDFVNMPRAGYTGSQQYAIFWGGDTSGTPWGLRSAIIAAQRSAILGFAIWGSDTGGYHSGSNRDTTARWLGFSAFCPLMEVGPTRNVGLWNAPWEPSYDTELLAAWSLYAQIHEKIGDYIHGLARKAHESGDPIIRPLFVQFPGDAKAVKWWDEYMLGDDILVCPLWEKGATKRKVYLPGGEWVDPWEADAVRKGPTEIEVDCPLHKTPFYIRKGSSVKVGNPKAMFEEAMKRCAEKPNMADLLRKANMR